MQCFCGLSAIQPHVLSARLQSAPPLSAAAQLSVVGASLQHTFSTCATNTF